MLEVLLELYVGGALVMLGYLVHRAQVDPSLEQPARIVYPTLGAVLWPWTLYWLRGGR